MKGKSYTPNKVELSLDTRNMKPMTLREFGKIEAYRWILNYDGKLLGNLTLSVDLGSLEKAYYGTELVEFAKVVLPAGHEVPLHCHPWRKREYSVSDKKTVPMIINIDDKKIELKPSSIRGLEEHYFPKCDGELIIACSNPDHSCSVMNRVNLSELPGGDHLKSVIHPPDKYLAIRNLGKEDIAYYVRGRPPFCDEASFIKPSVISI
jgi:hypothetical protein